MNTAGAQNAAEPWNRERELAVGGLRSITLDDSNPEINRWRTEPRLDGHRLDEVTVDNTTYGIAHDDSGRLTTGLDFEYGPHGRLYAAFGTDADEFYLYDGDGKLVHIERRDNSGHILEAESFAYDGDQMVASFDAAGVPIWEAIWGAQQDHLIECAREYPWGATWSPTAGTARSATRTGPRKQQIPRVCSFTAGTPVLMCDGSLRPIEEVEEGDFVVARDEETGAIECREVIDPYENPDRSIIVIELAGPDGVIEQIETRDPGAECLRAWRADTAPG